VSWVKKLKGAGGNYNFPTEEVTGAQNFMSNFIVILPINPCKMGISSIHDFRGVCIFGKRFSDRQQCMGASKCPPCCYAGMMLSPVSETL